MRVLSPRFCSDNPLSSSVSRLARLSNLLSFFYPLVLLFLPLLKKTRASLKLPSKKRNSSLSHHHHPLLRSADFFVSSHKHQHQSFPVISSPERGETCARSLRGRAPPLRSDEGKKGKNMTMSPVVVRKQRRRVSFPSARHTHSDGALGASLPSPRRYGDDAFKCFPLSSRSHSRAFGWK